MNGARPGRVVATWVGPVVALVLLSGCEQIKEQCNLACPEQGVLEGNASISGVPRVDAFFSAVLNYRAAASALLANVTQHRRTLAVSVMLDPGNASTMEIGDAIRAHIAEHVDGMKVTVEPARCTASAHAVLEANARCEGTVMPPKVEVECKGSCEVEASIDASCEGNATLVCRGTAPKLECSGMCRGSCNLSAAARCSGVCRGTCTGTCSVTDAAGGCAGQCDGMCQGECELRVAGSCMGECRGECEYTPAMGSCEADARVECRASADASIMCNGRCSGEVVPPKASVECEATVKAEARLSVECTPPRVEVGYQWKTTDEMKRARFLAWLERVKTVHGQMVAEIRRSEELKMAGDELSAAANDAVKSAIMTAQSEMVDIQAAFGLSCAVDELGDAGTVIGEAGSDISMARQDARTIRDAFAGV